MFSKSSEFFIRIDEVANGALNNLNTVNYHQRNGTLNCGLSDIVYYLDNEIYPISSQSLFDPSFRFEEGDDAHSHSARNIDDDIDTYDEYIGECWWTLFNNSICEDQWLNVINSSLIDDLSYYKNSTYHNNTTTSFMQQVNIVTDKRKSDWNQYDEKVKNNRYDLDLAELIQNYNVAIEKYEIELGDC